MFLLLYLCKENVLAHGSVVVHEVPSHRIQKAKMGRQDKMLMLISTVLMQICNKLSWGLLVFNYKCLSSGPQLFFLDFDAGAPKKKLASSRWNFAVERNRKRLMKGGDPKGFTAAGEKTD